MRVIIAGGRTYHFDRQDVLKLNKLLNEMPDMEVVTGCANGADKNGEAWADVMKLKVHRFPAHWNKYGKRAGYLRNVEMSENAEAVVLFPGGRGTDMMYDIAKKKGLIIYDWRENE